ncbi:hypothetical protein C8J57DRAFT_1249401 [Mycena rebaudengoi]|nr:hypothetical protein C8J57DRAFT_1249401 [Mycena rebaudengoi]
MSVEDNPRPHSIGDSMGVMFLWTHKPKHILSRGILMEVPGPKVSTERQIWKPTLIPYHHVMVEQKAGSGELTISADGGQHRLPTNIGGLSASFYDRSRMCHGKVRYKSESESGLRGLCYILRLPKIDIGVSNKRVHISFLAPLLRRSGLIRATRARVTKIRQRSDLNVWVVGIVTPPIESQLHCHIPADIVS